MPLSVGVEWMLEYTILIPIRCPLSNTPTGHLVSQDGSTRK